MNVDIKNDNPVRDGYKETKSDKYNLNYFQTFPKTSVHSKLVNIIFPSV